MREGARQEARQVGFGAERGGEGLTERGLGADSAGVAIEGVVVDAAIGEFELLVDGFEGGRAAIDWVRDSYNFD
ncbi:MAG: hypothetical protein H6819_03475 [Phycisphaerales bacterium]|nr:hypothetical protein [Phycisphaerales bacterium]MCB9856257.1 hypothetical protein [Phycisphaerales bacterium]MCB9863304.1 hypothetical protein [Phycisphaerales bacterium]